MENGRVVIESTKCAFPLTLCTVEFFFFGGGDVKKKIAAPQPLFIGKTNFSQLSRGGGVKNFFGGETSLNPSCTEVWWHFNAYISTTTFNVRTSSGSRGK